MLTELVVRDLGVIDELELVLGSSMTAVTGETGAGKTLVVGAIDLLTGGRADSTMVRPGAESAEIEGRFVLAAGAGAAGDEPEEVVLRRVVPASGRSRGYVNGRMATVAELSEQGRRLVDLHGQHAHQSLLRAAAQRDALDHFASVDTSKLKGLRAELAEIDLALQGLGGDESARAREIDFLRHQLAEIEGAHIADASEDKRLSEEELVLANAAALRESARVVVGLLDADGPLSDGMGQALGALAGHDPFKELTERIENAAAEIADIATEARALAETLQDDPARLAAIRERRDLLAELRRKYGPTLADVLQFESTASKRLSELEHRDERAADLDRRRAETMAAIGEEEAHLLGLRSEAAPRLAAAVEAHLGDLAMGGARMVVNVEGRAGQRVEFQLAANPGHEPRPLARVASGGELARVMLALRLVQTAGPETLVFDEVDAGIGGAAAHAVGHKLASLAADHQVLVVTHLAQVAANAHHHVVVEKTDGASADDSDNIADHESSSVRSADDHPEPARVSGVRTLSEAEREVELSRMLSGSPQSEAARRHAQELLAAPRR